MSVTKPSQPLRVLITTSTSMEPSLRIIPGLDAKSASIQDTAGTFGVHDTLRYGLRSLAAEVRSDGGQKARLENWDATQDNAKLTLQRDIYGLHAPMRLLMERKIVAANPLFPELSHSNIHLDILMGRDELIAPADVFLGMESGPSVDPRAEMERRCRI